jgi:acetylcholinesterase/cholinesterase
MSFLLLLLLPAAAAATADDAAYAASVAALAAPASPAGPVVGTAAGQIRGSVGTGGVLVFRGIPYAEPPTGALRWQDPVAKSPWAGVRPATEDGAGCPQQCRLPAITCPPVQSEDCLFLNVFVPPPSSPPSSSSSPFPSLSAAKPKAVMFWIHGGDFYQGYGGGLLYDGTVLAQEEDVVVVAINYRLGALGFLYSGPDKSTQFTGNFGLRDQQLALRWVQQNIAKFGGNPNQVTIFGQSAGGASVASHLNMPSSKGLFARAILQSNPVGLPFRTADKAPKFTSFVAKDAGCTETVYEPCMRALSWEKVLAAAVSAESNLFIEIGNFLSLFQPYSPVVGTPELAEQPMIGFLNGTSMDVPTMMGSVQQEGLIFVYEAFAKGPTSRTVEDTLLAVIYGVGNVGKILKQYPRNKSKLDQRNHTAPIVTDSLFHCPIRHISLRMANRSRANYVYHFNHVLTFGDKFWDPSAPICVGNVCHGEELALVFDPNLARINATYSTDEQALARSMQTYWANFAKTGNPGAGWPAMESKEEEAMVLETPKSVVVKSGYAAKCQLWDDLGYEWVLRHS